MFLLEPIQILVDDTRSVSLSLIMLVIRWGEYYDSSD